MQKINYKSVIIQLLHMTEKEMNWPSRLKYQLKDLMLRKEYVILGPKDSI